MTVALLSILAALLVGAISPGPSFVVVAQVSVARSRRSGLAAALGMGVGGMIFGALALLGLQTLLVQAAWLYLALKLLGGAYLLYVAIQLWLGAGEPLVLLPGGGAHGAARGPLLVGLAMQLGNPKTAVVYGSVFAAFLPPSLPAWAYLVLPLMIFAIEAGWYSVVALAFSADGPRAAYLRSKMLVDRTAGTVMGALGIKLIVEAARSVRVG